MAWGRDAAPVEVEHSAVVISEEALLNRLDAISPAGEPDGARAAANWTIWASTPFAGGGDGAPIRIAGSIGDAGGINARRRTGSVLDGIACGRMAVPDRDRAGVRWLLATGERPEGSCSGAAN